MGNYSLNLYFVPMRYVQDDREHQNVPMAKTVIIQENND